VLGLGDVDVAAPFLFVAVLLCSYAVLRSERGRARELVAQGIAYAWLTAALSAVGLTFFYALVPHLAPDGGRSVLWIAFILLFAALPLDPFRMLVVERLGRALFKNPIGVRDLADQVERTEVRADQAERLAEIGRLASAVAHEIRNPLGIIAAQAKLLERAGASPASVAALRAQVDRAKHFLDDLLRYSKPRPLEIQHVDVAPALELVANNVRLLLGSIAPRIEVDAPGTLSVEADRGAFQDVATVLVHNAAIAVRRCANPSVVVRAKREGGSVVVTVEDNGPGVSKEIEPRLFEPFVTGRGRDAEHPGTGLGLAIAARWVERHGGGVRHERPERGGARFVVRWPERPWLAIASLGVGVIRA
jgi:signal transduction histidine kinase